MGDIPHITYIATEEDELFLAAAIDLFSRKVAGWSMRSDMHRSLVSRRWVSAASVPSGKTVDDLNRVIVASSMPVKTVAVCSISRG
jgi:hypothetical protein